THPQGFRFVVLPAVPETRTAYVRGRRHEETESRVITQWLRPGDFAIDCGANIGVMVALMAHSVGEAGTVLAVEAAPPTASKLQAVITALQLTGVRIIRKCVTDTGGDVLFSADMT